MSIAKRVFWLLILASIAAFPANSHAVNDGMARKLINSQGCKACHALEGDGGTLSVSFESMRTRLSRTEIRLQLVNQAGRHGNNAIADFSHLGKTEIDALVVFIQPTP